jgi:TolA-binding protein
MIKMKISYIASVCLLACPFQFGFAYENMEDVTELSRTVEGLASHSQKQNSELFKKIVQLEEQIRELQGNIQHVEHTNKQLMAKINNVNEDMSYRFAQMEKSSSGKDSLKSIKEYVSMIESGKVKDARVGLLDYIKYKKGNAKGIAYYWLGKSYMAERAYKDAGTYFLKSYKYYPANEKAPESLLGLAVSLRNIDKKNRACSILKRLDAEYPNRPDEKKEISQGEYSALKCS